MKNSFLQLHFAVLLAGFTGILGELITLNEGLLVWYRLLISTVTLWVLFAITQKLRKIPIQDILRIIGAGFLSAVHWLFFFAAIKYSNVSVGLVCLSTVGFFSAILEPVLNKRRINISNMLFGIFSMLGIYIIFHFDTQYQWGLVLGLTAAFFAALFPILLKSSMKKTNMQTVLVWQMTGGFITFSLIMPAYLHFFPVTTIIPTAKDFMWLLVLAWVCSVVAFQFSMNALKKLSAFTVSLSYSLEPLYGIIMSFIILKENKYLTKGFYFGLMIICVTLILHTLLLKQRYEKRILILEQKKTDL